MVQAAAVWPCMRVKWHPQLSERAMGGNRAYPVCQVAGPAALAQPPAEWRCTDAAPLRAKPALPQPAQRPRLWRQPQQPMAQQLPGRQQHLLPQRLHRPDAAARHRHRRRRHAPRRLPAAAASAAAPSAPGCCSGWMSGFLCWPAAHPQARLPAAAGTPAGPAPPCRCRAHLPSPCLPLLLLLLLRAGRAPLALAAQGSAPRPARRLLPVAGTQTLLAGAAEPQLPSQPPAPPSLPPPLLVPPPCRPPVVAGAAAAAAGAGAGAAATPVARPALGAASAVPAYRQALPARPQLRLSFSAGWAPGPPTAAVGRRCWCWARHRPSRPCAN